MRRLVITALTFILFACGAYVYLANIHPPLAVEDVTYGATFSVFRTNELRLDWKETYEALITDMGIRRFRLVAHWPMVEPEDGRYNFEELDYQMRRAEETGSRVILAIGKRLPSWPECHLPEWVLSLSKEAQEVELLEYMDAVIQRYKDSPALALWQVENEPFIIGYAIEQCGSLDVQFLESEIEFVRLLDPQHPVLLTASGELGLFDNTWKRADVFGTTLYRRVWNLDLNSYVTYPTTPGFYRAKRALAEITTKKERSAIIAELALESWTKKATYDTPLEDQLERMNVDLFNETIEFAAATGFPEQYAWGAEWWYYLKEVHGYNELWERAKELYQ